MHEKPFEKTPEPSDLDAEELFGKESLADVYIRVMADLRSVSSIFSERIEDSDLASAFARGLQWDAQEIADHIQQKRIPYVFDQISSKVSALQGAHAVLRTEAKALPVEMGDEDKAAIFNRFIKWNEQVNKIDQIEDQVFYDTTVEGAGATVVRWELSDFLYGRPVVERIPIRQLRWDARSVDVELKDARWMARVMFMTRQEAIEEMPEYADIIAAEGVHSYDESGISDEEILTINQREVNEGEQVWENTRSYVRVVEHYERWTKTAYVVSDGVKNTVEEFDNKHNAETYAQGLVDAYAESPDINLLDDNGDELIVIVPIKKDVIIQSIVIGGHCVSSEATDLPAFPFQVCFCYHHNGTYWSYVDLMVSPQRFLNRQISNMDEQMGRGTKQFATVRENMLRKGVTIDDFNRERSKPAGSLSVNDHGAINFHANTPVQAEIVPAISMAISHMTDIVGGKNVLGLQENAAESGAAVRARQEAAGLSRVQIFTHINNWRRQVTEMSLWFMKNYLPPGQQLRILGSDKKAEYIEVDQEALDTLANTRTDIVITEALDTDSVRERQYVQLKELFQTLGASVPPDIALSMMLEMSTLPEDVKAQIRSQMKSLQDFYAAQQQQKELNDLWQSAEKSVIRADMKQRLENQAAVNDVGGTTTP
jgi:hypothetical protein